MSGKHQIEDLLQICYSFCLVKMYGSQKRSFCIPFYNKSSICQKSQHIQILTNRRFVIDLSVTSLTNLSQIFDLSGFVSLTKTSFLSGQFNKNIVFVMRSKVKMYGSQKRCFCPVKMYGSQKRCFCHTF